MDVIKALKNVKGLDDYVSITEDMLKNIANFTLKLNSSGTVMDTIRILKSIQSVEVQYFHMYNKCGAAAIIFELLLGVPALEKDSAFGKELVCVVQFWLSRVREFLIHKNEYWWKFLRNLLDFIQKLYLKHPMIVEYLVKYTGESLLDLATQKKPSTDQRYQILLCFNCYSKPASRELRNVMKDKYDVYFTRLAAWLARCGDTAAQWAALETLLRWLLPRHDARARRDAAARWLPAALYPPRALQLFIDSTWLNFARDARLFLNETNEQSDSVVSVCVEKLSVGSVTLVSARSRERWLDLNTGTRSVAMMVDLCKILNVVSEVETCPGMTVTEANTTSAQMCSGPRGTVISLEVIDPLQIFPAKVLENKNQIKVSIILNNNLQKVDKALKTIFDTKYQLLKNDDSTFISQNSGSSGNMEYIISEEDTRFSHPPEILRRKLLEQRAKRAAEQSPAASTSSNPMLAKKLKNLPDFELHIQNLATAPELSENTSHSSLRIPDHSGTDKSEQSSKNGSQNTDQGKDENDNDAISNNNDKNIIKLLAKEALQYSRTNALNNTQNQRSDVTRDTYFTYVNTRARRCDKREYTVRNDTTATDDSSTAFVENSPTINTNTTIRNRKPTCMHIDKDIYPRDSDFNKITFNSEAYETFFSEHVAHDGNCNVIVSPILARKLTHSNRDSQSATFILRPPQTEASLNFNYQEVVDCLNCVVNYVCENLPKNMNQNSNQNNCLKISEIEAGPRNTRLEKPTNSLEKDKKISNNKTKAKKLKAKISPVKLRFKTIEKQTKTIKKNNKLDLNSREKKSPIIEKETERRNLDKTTTADYLETALSKRKRKLYSTKDDNLINKRTGVHVSETEEDNSNLTSCKPANKSLVSTATPYKEIEKMRKKAAMQLRNRGSKVVSPKTEIANNLFDQLKNTTENNDKITIVDKGAVYNFSTDDDEDFKKITDTSKNKSKKLRRVKRDLYKPEKSASKDDTNRNTQINKRTCSKQQIVKKHVTTEPLRELIDERMREATTEVLNTSLINKSHIEEINTELQPAHKIPRMEIIPDDKKCEIVTSPVIKKTKNQTKNTAKRGKRGKKAAKNKLVITDKADDDGKTISPLPGLEIEIQRVNEPDESIIKLDKLNNKSEGDLATLDFQNLLSESERVDNSPPRLNITDELVEPIIRPSNNFAVKDTERVRSSKSSSVSKTPSHKQLVVVLERTDIHSLKSISTVGNCPITAHGEIDEAPPQIKEIDRTISPRGWISEEFNSPDVIDFYNRLANDFNVSNKRNSKTSEHPEKSNSAPDTSSNISTDAKLLKSPSVCLRRLSEIEIDSYLSPSRNLVVDSASTSRKSERSIRISNKQPVNDKSTRARRSIISPIEFEETILIKESTSRSEERPTQRDSNRYDLRKGSAKKKILSLEDSEKKGDEGNTSAVKRRKLEEKEHTTASSEALPSVSSVDDWLRRNENREQSSREEVIDEILSSISEKLDTTLFENRQHIRSSLAKVLAQTWSRIARLASKAEELRQLIQQLKEQIESVHEEVPTHIEDIFRDLVRKDSDLVAIVREDIQAAKIKMFNRK